MVLFGLGNPGDRYRWTRHNLGFHVLDEFAKSRGVAWNRAARAYRRAECDVSGVHLFLIKPTTYVNLAGRGLREFRREVEIEPGELVVVADDIALPLGQLRLRRRGSHGGHNGLRAIADELQTSDFPRLRMGVGPVPPDDDPADFVLARICSDEREDVERLILRAVSCLEDLTARDFDTVMSEYNAPLADGESD